MKTTLVLGLVSIILQSQALAENSSRVTLSAQVAQQTVQITDQKFEPIYAEEPYETTCNREVLDHSETRCETVSDSVCSGGGESCETVEDSVCNSQGCTSVPRRVCHSEPQSCTSVPRQSCSSYPVYRTEYYSCTQYRTVVVGHRLVKTFQHQIEVLAQDASILAASKIMLNISASESNVSATALSNFPSALLKYEVQSISQLEVNSVVTSSERIVISQIMTSDQAHAIETAVLSGLELGRDAIRFTLQGAAGFENNLKLSIKIVRRPSLWFPTTLLDKTVTSETLSLVAQGRDIQALIPMQKLGMNSLNDVRYDLSLSIAITDDKILNESDFKVPFKKHFEQSLTKVRPSF